MHPLLARVRALCESGQIPFIFVPIDTGAALKNGEAGERTAATMRIRPDGALQIHLYGEDISGDERALFDGDSVDQAFIDFLTGRTPDPEEDEIPQSTPRTLPTEDMSVEDRLERLEAMVAVLAEDNQRMRTFIDAAGALFGARR